MVLIPIDQLAQMSRWQLEQALLAAWTRTVPRRSETERLRFADQLLEMSAAQIAELFGTTEQDAADAQPTLREIASRIRAAGGAR